MKTKGAMPIAHTHKYRPHAQHRQCRASGHPQPVRYPIAVTFAYIRFGGTDAGAADGKTYPLPSKARYRNVVGMKAENVTQQYSNIVTPPECILRV